MSVVRIDDDLHLGWRLCTQTLSNESKKAASLSQPLNLQPSIYLTNPRPDGPIPRTKVSIKLQRDFLGKGPKHWKWHKNWNLPTLTIKVTVRDPETGETLLCPDNLCAEVMGARPSADKASGRLCQVTMQGTVRRDIVNGMARFEGLKFGSTSYKNEGIKFNLVIGVFASEPENTQRKVLAAYISDPIFVDSRKPNEVELETMEVTSPDQVFEVFTPSKVEEALVKKDTKKKPIAEIPINDDFEGFLNYFTSPNIRHKIRHPIFLALRFPSGIKLHYNTQWLKNAETLENIILQLHSELSSKWPPRIALDKAPILIHFATKELDAIKAKKIVQVFDGFRSSPVRVVCDDDNIPEYFRPIADSEALKQAYISCFTKLFCISGFNQSPPEEKHHDPPRIAPEEIQLPAKKSFEQTDQTFTMSLTSPDPREVKAEELKTEEMEQLSEETLASHPLRADYYEKREESMQLSMNIEGNSNYMPLMMNDPFLAHMMMINGVEKLKFISQDSNPPPKEQKKLSLAEILQSIKVE